MEGSNYILLKYLGEGVFGKVAKCMKEDTKEIVAIKIPTSDNVVQKEVSMLKHLRCLDADKTNIVKFYENLTIDGRTCLVFEMLDITLYDYLKQREFIPLRLKNIRFIIQQMATAFEALKSIGVIHADVKLDNIMLVDHLREPFKLKLIDFGVALLRSEAKKGSSRQNLTYRSPEILLGLPFSEAIDMWSLGCMMWDLFTCRRLFPGSCEYDMMRFIVDLLGMPADHLLNAGLKTTKSFIYSSPGCWRLLTPEEYRCRTGDLCTDNRLYTFRSLDELTEFHLEKKNKAEVADKRQLVDLLKQMLQMDASERITPSEVLTHPFITMSDLTSGSRHSFHTKAPPPAHIDSETMAERPSQPAASEPGSSQAQSRSKGSKKRTEVDDCARGTSTEALPGVILVQPNPDMASNQSVFSPQAVPAASPAVDSAIVAAPSVPLSSPVADPPFSVNQGVTNNNNRVDTNPAHATSEVSKPKKKKKGVRCFFSWLRRTFCCCGAAKVAPGE